MAEGEIIPGSSPERAPLTVGPERTDQPLAPEQLPPTPEKSAEQVAPEEQVAAASPVAPIAVPTIPPPIQPIVSPTTDDDSLPAVADDVDVIEMEWVNKAKQIIKDTKDDPHAQEQAVERLQRDYLKKRYGKEIKAAS